MDIGWRFINYKVSLEDYVLQFIWQSKMQFIWQMAHHMNKKECLQSVFLILCLWIAKKWKLLSKGQVESNLSDFLAAQSRENRWGKGIGRSKSATYDTGKRDLLIRKAGIILKRMLAL